MARDMITLPQEHPHVADELSPLSVPQTSRAAIRIGQRAVLEAEVVVTPLGLLAIGGLVAAILLSVAPVIRAAGKASRRSARG